MHPAHEVKKSDAKAPDYKTKADSLAVLNGTKKTWDEVHYRPAVQNASKMCHECKFYDKPGQSESSCSKVVGVVEAQGYCDLWEQTENSSAYAHNDAKRTITIKIGL